MAAVTAAPPSPAVGAGTPALVCAPPSAPAFPQELLEEESTLCQANMGPERGSL